MPANPSWMSAGYGILVLFSDASIELCTRYSPGDCFFGDAAVDCMIAFPDSFVSMAKSKTVVGRRSWPRGINISAYSPGSKGTFGVTLCQSVFPNLSMEMATV